MKIAFVTLILFFQFVQSSKAQVLCAKVLTAPTSKSAIAIDQNPIEFLRVFSKDASVKKKANKTILNRKMEELFLNESADQLDFASKQSRYYKVVQQVYRQIPETEYKLRLEEGDLNPLKKYVEEIKVDENGNTLEKPILPYKIINSALRENNQDPKIREQIASLDSALALLPNIEGIVYRGARVTKEEAKSILSGKLKTYESKSYTSTSSDFFDATEFLRGYFSTNETNIPTLMIIKTKNGKTVSMGTVFEREEEILIPRDAKFRIAKAYMDYRIRDIEKESPKVLYLFLDQI